LPALFEDLEMRVVMDHKIWKLAPSKQIEEHKVNCKTLVNVISHILGATKAQKALGFVPAGSPGEVQNIDDIEIWLSNFELDLKLDSASTRFARFDCIDSFPDSSRFDCIDTFRQMFVQPFLALAANQYGEASAMFRELCAECRNQKFGGIGSDTVKKLLCLVPDKHPARPLVAQFFDVLLDYKELVFTGRRPKQNGVDTLKKDVDDLLHKLSSSQLAAWKLRPRASCIAQTAASGQKEVVDTGLTETVAESPDRCSQSDFPATQICEDIPETMEMSEMDTGLRPPKKAKLTASQTISESLATFGLHDKQFLSFVEEMSKKVGEIVGDTVQQNVLRMGAAVEECYQTLEYVPISDKPFRVQMIKYGAALEKHQEVIDLILKELNGPIPIDQTVAAPVAEGKKAVNLIAAYTGTYVAMTLFQNSKVREGDKAQMEVLKGILGTLKQATDRLLATDGLGAIFPNEMAPIYALIEGVQSPAARPASAPSAGSSDPPHVAGPPSATSATSKGRGRKRKSGSELELRRPLARRSGALEEEEETQSLQGGA
jgi:hypothetical protein